MTKIASTLILSIFCFLFSTCTQRPTEETTTKWHILFDGSDLKGWDTYLGPIWDTDLTWETIRDQPAVGLNNDTANVFTIVDLNGEKVLRISGEIWGGISTQKEYENYHLQLKFKWGQKKWYPRDKDADKRDSGLLYHGSDPHGAGSGFWLSTQEFQIQEGDCGDYWAVGRSMIDIKAKFNEDSVFQYNPEGELLTFGPDMPNGNYSKKYPDNEKPNGEWNTLDLYCFKDKSIHMVNGKITMVLENSREVVNGKEIPLTKGKIQIQSEAAEVFYKDIRIMPIDELPAIEI